MCLRAALEAAFEVDGHRVVCEAAELKVGVKRGNTVRLDRGVAADEVEGCFLTEAAERGPARLRADRGAVRQGVIDSGHQLDAEDVLAHRHINEGDRAGGGPFGLVGPVGVEGDLQVLRIRLSNEPVEVAKACSCPADSGACVWRPARVVHEVVVRVGEELVGVVVSNPLVRRFLAAPLGVLALERHIGGRTERRSVISVVPVEVFHFEAQLASHVSEAEAAHEPGARFELVGRELPRDVVDAGRVAGGRRNRRRIEETVASRRVVDAAQARGDGGCDRHPRLDADVEAGPILLCASGARRAKQAEAHRGDAAALIPESKPQLFYSVFHCF